MPDAGPDPIHQRVRTQGRPARTRQRDGPGNASGPDLSKARAHASAQGEDAAEVGLPDLTFDEVMLPDVVREASRGDQQNDVSSSSATGSEPRGQRRTSAAQVSAIEPSINRSRVFGRATSRRRRS